MASSGTSKIVLLNQLEDKSHHAKSVKFIDNKYSKCGASNGWGYHTFIEQSALKLDSSKNIQYLKDDSVF